MTNKLDIHVPQGTRWRREFRFYSTYVEPDHDDNVPLDMTGYTVIAQCRFNENAPIIAEFDVTGDLSEGEVNLMLDNTERDIPACRWDMLCIPPNNGDPIKPFEGTVNAPTTISHE